MKTIQHPDRVQVIGIPNTPTLIQVLRKVCRNCAGAIIDGTTYGPPPTPQAGQQLYNIVYHALERGLSVEMLRGEMVYQMSGVPV